MKYKLEVGDKAMYINNDYGGLYTNTQVEIIQYFDSLYECRFFDGMKLIARSYELGPTKSEIVKEILDNL